MKVLEIGAEITPQAQHVWEDAEIVYLDINEVKDIPEMKGKRFILGDAADLAKVLDGETFDGIFASHVLEHFPWWDISRLLANWVTCLNPGGSIHIVVPSLEWAAKQILSETPSPALQGHLFSDMTTPYHIHAGGFTMRYRMAIVQGDLEFYYTGAGSHAAAQTDPDASLGDYRASSIITTSTDNNVFDDVSGAEASSGDTEYRAIAFCNNHGTLALTACVVWIQVDTGNGEDDISFDVEAPSNETNGYIQTIANESTAPTGLAGFSDATTKGTGVDCPLTSNEVGNGEWFGIWLRRIISASAGAAAAEAVTMRVEGDTAA
jgi:hypothetical protein